MREKSYRIFDMTKAISWTRECAINMWENKKSATERINLFPEKPVLLAFVSKVKVHAASLHYASLILHTVNFSCVIVIVCLTVIVVTTLR